MNEQDLREKLHSTLISKAQINDICEDLQVTCEEHVNQYNEVLSLSYELLEVNKKLRVALENERKNYIKLKEATTTSPEDMKRMKDAIESSKQLYLEIMEGIPELSG